MPWQIDGKPEDNRLSGREVATERLPKVHYVEGGNPDGLPVVLLHDNLTSSRWWEATQEQLSFRYRSLAPDLRGFGATSEGQVNSLEAFALDLADFVKTLGLPKFFLVGWGMGGGIAMQYAIQYPDSLAGLCLVNSISPQGHREQERDEQLAEIGRALAGGQSGEVATYIRRNYFRSGNFPVGDLSEGGESGSGENAQAAAFDYILAGSLQDRNFRYVEQGGLFKAMREFNVHKAVGHLKMPVFNITGDSDRLISQREMDETRQAFATVRYDETVIPLCGHSPMVERAEAFINALNGYIGRLNFQQVVHPSTISAVEKMEESDRDPGAAGYGTTATTDIAYQEGNNSL